MSFLLLVLLRFRDNNDFFLRWQSYMSLDDSHSTTDSWRKKDHDDNNFKKRSMTEHNSCFLYLIFQDNRLFDVNEGTTRILSNVKAAFFLESILISVRKRKKNQLSSKHSAIEQREERFLLHVFLQDWLTETKRWCLENKSCVQDFNSRLAPLSWKDTTSMLRTTRWTTTDITSVLLFLLLQTARLTQ